MKNSEALIAELKAILKKYDAEIEIVDNYTDHISNKTMELMINSKYDSDGNCIQEFEFVDIGKFIDSL